MSTPVRKLGNIFQIGTQIDLPFAKIGEIAWRNMKHRFGRSLVTTSGVILATAFLMAMLIKNSVVGSMLEATRSLKLVALEVPLTDVQARNIRTVLTNQAPGFNLALKDANDVLSESKKNVTDTAVDLKRLNEKLLAVTRLERNPAAGKEAEFTAAVALVTQRQADLDKARADKSPDIAAIAADLEKLTAARDAVAVTEKKPVEGKEKEFRDAQDLVTQRERDMTVVNDTVKAAEEVVALAKTQVDFTTDLLTTATAGKTFTILTGTPEQRKEAEAKTQFLQRLGKGLENELQAHAVQEAPPAAAPAVPGAAVINPAPAAAAAGPVAAAAPGGFAAPKDLWLTGLALIVAGVGITNAMLMSVTERFREIGTMKCLGALDSFILKLFLLESAVQGGMGTLAGLLLGSIMMTLYLWINFGWDLMWAYWPWQDVGVDVLVAFAAGVVISIIGAAFPSLYASRMDPIAAMRQEI